MRAPIRKVQLARAISKLGAASRTQAEAMIKEGRVSLRGRIVRDPKFLVVPETAGIEIDGVAVAKAARVVLLMHKPKGLVTTRSDEKGRRTVFELLKGTPWERLSVHAVGRLDMATTGLLLLTNDTRFSARLTDPANEIPRRYVVTVRGLFDAEKARAMESGVRDAGEILKASSVEILKDSRRETHLMVELRQGKNREIRRLFELAGHEVTKLKRIAYGGLELGELAVGKVRLVGVDELRRGFGDWV